MQAELSKKYSIEIGKRRTFAIISHPDAGKTTLTEKFLLFGGAIQTAGAVKSNKIKKHATSDFMEIERQRGISVATSVMSFESQPNHKSNPVIINPLAGVVVEIPIIYGFSVQPEVQFVTRGTNLKAIREGNKAKAIIDEGNYFSDYSIDNLAEPEQRDNGFADEKEQFNLPNLYENIKIKLNYLEGQLMFLSPHKILASKYNLPISSSL